MSYDWDVSRQATERILRLPRKQRDKLIDFFDRIGKDFEGISETSFPDSDGVPHQVATLDSWVVTFVVDHPVRLVHIVAVE